MHLIRTALLTLACAGLTAPAAASAATVPATGANPAATITRTVIYKGGGDDTPVGPAGPLKMASQAASASTNPKVGETVLKNGTWHKYEAKYWNLPGRIALMEPSNREVSGLQWFSWTRTGGHCQRRGAASRRLLRRGRCRHGHTPAQRALHPHDREYGRRVPPRSSGGRVWSSGTPS